MSTKGGYVEILEFTHFSQVFRFNHTGEIGRKKEIFRGIISMCEHVAASGNIFIPYSA